MSDLGVPDDVLAIVEVVARAIRDELGEDVEAYPGYQAPEGADPLNLAFRAAVRSLLATAGVPSDNLSACVSRTLLLVATRRLKADGFDALRVKGLIEDEPGSPDDWLAFLILSSHSQIERLSDDQN